jgi:uncharacterized protein
MRTQSFINLPVADIARSVTFFKALGFQFDPRFTNETTACMILSDTSYAMLHDHTRFADFTSKAIADTATTAEALVGVALDSRAKVHTLVDTAIKVGGRETRPTNDHGFMLQRAFEDPDGHTWEIVWMDEAAFEAARVKETGSA